MSLYFVQHQHNAETCPARDPVMGPLLLSHLSPLNARKFGVKIQSDAVLDGQHSLVLIVEADQSEQVEQFMGPFKQVGQVQISPASTCEVVVDRAGC